MDDKFQNEVSLEKATDEQLSPKKPLSFGTYLDLPISEEDRDLHKDYIFDRIDEILNDADRIDVMDNAEVYRNQYNGVVGNKFPEWGFNLDMRLTPKIQDAVVSQTEEAFDDVDPHWSVGPALTKEMMAVREKQEKTLDFYEDTEMETPEEIEGIRHDAFLLGLGWEALVFERKFERIREFRIYNTVEEFMRDFPDDFHKYNNYLVKLASGEKVTLIVDVNHEVRRSPKRKHIEFEDGICPLSAKGVEGVNNADCKGRRIWMRWDEIKRLEEEGDYIKGVSDKLMYKSERKRDGQLDPDPEYLNKSFETFEMIYDMYIEIDGKKKLVRTMWNIEKDHRVCLRAIRYPYHHNRSYMIPHCIQYTNSGLYQDGMGRKLHDLHVAGNATINHILDASVIANSLSLKVRSGTDSARRIMEHRWFPGSVLELQNVDDVQQFNFSTPNLSSMIQLFSLIERFGQDVSGIVNYSMGVADAEDPEAPASKTIALMRKAEIKLRRYIKNLRRSENEAGYQALRLIYQFTPVERLREILGDENIDESKMYMREPMKVITNATGFAIEKIFAKRDNMTMAGNLLKDPLVAADSIRRSRLWYTIAADFGSSWDKKIIGIMPSPEELEQEQAKRAQEQQQKKIQAVQKAATQVLEQGGTPEEAKEVALQAGEMFENMVDKQKMMAQQGAMQQQQGGQ